MLGTAGKSRADHLHSTQDGRRQTLFLGSSAHWLRERRIMPQLAAFPKAFMVPLCRDGTMRISQWVDIAANLNLDGVEWYAGFLEMQDPRNWQPLRKLVEDRGLTIPMLCCSPDFTHPDANFRRKQVEQQMRWMDMAADMGAGFCRVLSGQRRPELSQQQGIDYAVQCIQACLSHAQHRGVTLTIENHYKDDFWQYPEFAQKMDIFCQLVAQIDHPYFGVNYDPSNTYLAGEDPLELLRRVCHRLVTMHASDRYLVEGTLEDLRHEESGAEGYAKRLRHGQIGKGLNDYDAIFDQLARCGFNGWISIEDGVESVEQLRGSVAFLRDKIAQYWPG
jgi:sugar phosphate isomerase/epimerase